MGASPTTPLGNDLDDADQQADAGDDRCEEKALMKCELWVGRSRLCDVDADVTPARLGLPLRLIELGLVHRKR